MAMTTPTVPIASRVKLMRAKSLLCGLAQISTFDKSRARDQKTINVARFARDATNCVRQRASRLVKVSSSSSAPLALFFRGASEEGPPSHNPPPRRACEGIKRNCHPNLEANRRLRSRKRTAIARQVLF